MTADRRAAIVQLLCTRDDHLPQPMRRTEASVGFVHSVPDNTETCPDCLANDRVTFDCETCGGSGRIRRPRARDPYATETVLPFGFDGSKHDLARERDRQIDMLDRQLSPPRSEADMLADANRHPYVWEIARRRMYRLYDYAILDRALERLRDIDHSAYRALHACFVYGWLAEKDAPHSIIERGLVFLHDRLPRLDHTDLTLRRELRSPTPPREQHLAGKLSRSAGAAAREIRNGRIRELAAEGKKPAEIAATCFVSIRTVYETTRAA